MIRNYESSVWKSILTVSFYHALITAWHVKIYYWYYLQQSWHGQLIPVCTAANFLYCTLNTDISLPFIWNMPKVLVFLDAWITIDNYYIQSLSSMRAFPWRKTSSRKQITFLFSHNLKKMAKTYWTALLG